MKYKNIFGPARNKFKNHFKDLTKKLFNFIMDFEILFGWMEKYNYNLSRAINIFPSFYLINCVTYFKLKFSINCEEN